MRVSSSRVRGGFGASIVLSGFVIAMVGASGIAGWFLTSGSGRTFARIVDVRRTIELGECAGAEAMRRVATQIRASGAPADPLCAGPWRQELLTALENSPGTALSGAARPVSPKRTRELLPAGTPLARVDDVQVKLVVVHAEQGGTWQGVYESVATVRSTGAGLVTAAPKTVRQRWYFSAQGRHPQALFTMDVHPLATIIE